MVLWLLAVALASAGVQCSVPQAERVARGCGGPDGAGCARQESELKAACRDEEKKVRARLAEAPSDGFDLFKNQALVFAYRYESVIRAVGKMPRPQGTPAGGWPDPEGVVPAWQEAIEERIQQIWDGEPAADAPTPKDRVKAARTVRTLAPGDPADPVRDAELELAAAGKTAPEVKAWLAREYQLAGSTASAGRLLDEALRAEPGHVESLGLRAVNRLAGGDPEGAREDARAALGRDPSNELGRQVLAYLASAGASGRVRAPKSLAGFEAAPDPGAAGAPVAAAVPHAAAGAPLGAPPRARALALVSESRRKAALGDLTGAVLEATRAIALDRSDPAAWTARAQASNKAGKWEAARADAEEALKLAPEDPAARLERAFALLQQGRAAEALADAEAVLSAHPGSGLAHLYRAMALEKLGRPAEASAAYREAAARDPGLAAVVDEALARLGGSAAPDGRGRRRPSRPVLWIALAVAAAGLLLMEGLKRLGRPGWRTTGPLLQPEPRRAAGVTLPAGTTLGNYRIDAELARGGMGIVYRATDVLLERRVAVKQLKAELYGEPGARERFLREAQLAAKLRHPGLAEVFSVIEEGELFLVFEFVEGEGLDALLARRGRLPPAETARLLEPVCAAVDYAHSRRVIHRDLKPSNVMVGRDGASCKVLDFGIAHEARTASAETRTAAWGTPPYMAPEQEGGAVSPRSDLYSLAVLAYELSAGQRPFPGHGALMLKAQGRFHSPSALGLPAALDPVFARALAPEPAARFESAAAFLAAFRAAAA